MQTCHLLLGRPWQRERKVLYQESTNKYAFIFNGRRVVLKPMTTEQVAMEEEKAQIKAKEEGEKIRGEVPQSIYSIIEDNIDWGFRSSKGE